MSEKRRLKRKADKNDFRKEKRKGFIILGSVTVIVWLVVFVIRVVNTLRAGGTIESIMDNLFVDILNNILGIIPPILLFDFGLEYLNRDYASREMSRQISEVLMGDSQIIGLFDDKAKRDFLNATITALVENDVNESEMAQGAIEAYITEKYDIRPEFKYHIDVRNCSKSHYFNPDDYIIIAEELSYNKVYIATEPIGKRFHIGFFVENSELDKQLRQHNYIMREALSLFDSDFERLKALDKAGCKEFAENELRISASIDDIKCVISDVIIDDNGIDVEFERADYNSPDKSNQQSVNLSFVMPQRKDNLSFLVSISQPSFEPEIRFTFPHDVYDVKTFPFFDDTVSTGVKDATKDTGVYHLNVKDKWVHPMSGVVFLLNEKN